MAVNPDSVTTMIKEKKAMDTQMSRASFQRRQVRRASEDGVARKQYIWTTPRDTAYKAWTRDKRMLLLLQVKLYFSARLCRSSFAYNTNSDSWSIHEGTIFLGYGMDYWDSQWRWARMAIIHTRRIITKVLSSYKTVVVSLNSQSLITIYNKKLRLIVMKLTL